MEQEYACDIVFRHNDTPYSTYNPTENYQLNEFNPIWFTLKKIVIGLPGYIFVTFLVIGLPGYIFVTFKLEIRSII